jgi:hypothetical protein
MLYIGGISIPLLASPSYREDVSNELGIEYVSKIDKALYYLNLFNNMGLSNITVFLLLDSWYSSNSIITNVVSNLPNVTMISGIRCNRRVNSNRIDTHRYLKSDSIRYEEGKYLYELYIEKGYLNNIDGCFTFLKSIRIDKETGLQTIRYLFCSNNYLSAVSILNIYKIRWNIEVFHRILKFRFRLEDIQFYSLVSVTKSIETKALDNLLTLCIISLGFSIRHIVKSYGIENIINKPLAENIISFTLKEIRTIVISKKSDYEIFTRKVP